MRPRLNLSALILSGVCGDNQALLLTSQDNPTVKRGGAASCYGGVFSCRDRTTGCHGRKDECGQVQRHPEEKLFQSLWTSDWAEGSPSNKTMTLSTQLKGQRSGFRTTLDHLDWPGQSPKPSGASLERPEHGGPPTFTIRPDGTGEDLH